MTKNGCAAAGLPTFEKRGGEALDNDELDAFIKEFLAETDRRTEQLMLGFSPYRDEYIPPKS